MENLITSYLMGVCENNNISYTHKVLANCFNCFYVDYYSVSFGMIQIVKELSKVNNYHLRIEVNKEYTELDGKIEVKKTILFAYFE